jgi:ATP-dependent Clp protease ATP-binding subunit ClpC
LKDRIIFSLNVNSLVAGTRYRGEMEEKIGEVIGAAKEYGVILFIDELHSVVGAGGSEGGLSVAEILKPAVTDGDIAVIGATTYAEYGKYIENDPALCRRFMKVEVAEPSKEEAIRILAGVKPSFEKHYGITVENEAAEACVKLSLRYISGKFLPDKAIDILDEACAKKAISGGKNVDVDDIKDAVNEMTGIPLGNIAESETEKFLNLEKYLNEKIIGQEEAVTSVAKAVRRAEAGLREKNKPSSSFIFLGSTGVGKTETAKALAETLYGGEDAMIRIDMSEYSETNSVSRLIGAPPGYVGYSEGGILTEAVRRKPYCLILFDELEKADPEIFNVLLQVLDDGRLTDGKGRTADFRNATIIFTSNLGTDKLIAKKTVGFGKADESKEDSAILMSALKNFLRPEFLNRIDKIIIFNKLSKESLIKIAKLLLNEKSKNLYEERGIKLNYGDELAEFIVNGSYDPNYGARPIKRQIETQLEDKLSETIIRDDLRNTEMTVKVIGDGLVISENK